MVAFTISSEDYLSALRLHMRRYWARSPTPKLVVSGLLLVCVAAMVFTAFDTTVTSAAIGAMIALVCLPLLQYFVLLPYQARRIYRHQKSLHYPVQASWSDQGYSAASKDVSGTTRWNDFYGWSADARIILFMQSPVFFQMLPRRALSDEQADELFADLARSGLKRL